jgi:hypothetical protein
MESEYIGLVKTGEICLCLEMCNGGEMYACGDEAALECYDGRSNSAIIDREARFFGKLHRPTFQSL